jgi:hypothetical protein
LSLLTQGQIEDADEEFWRWIFRENDGPDHPLKISNDGKAQIQRGPLLILAGSLPDDIPKNRTMKKLPNIEYIFVPGENCVYTMADGDGQTLQDLVNKANNDMTNSQAKVLVNRVRQTIHRLSAHTFSPLLDILKCIDGAGNSGQGEGASCLRGRAPRDSQAAAACDYAIIPADTLKSGDIIKIEGIGRAGPNQVTRRIDVTYKLQ